MLSVFKLPLGVCHRLNKQVARFWWGNPHSTTRRIHWKSWASLCLPKIEGCLGFRDSISINQSMLGQLCSRLLRSPNSLVAQILKGRYYPHGTLLSAKNGSSPSWEWSSILHGRELLLQGSRWLVGNGTNISILSDNWLPSSPPSSPSPGPTTSPIPTVVAELIENGHWNRRLLSELVTPSTEQLILSIPLPSTSIADSWVWHYTNSGMYSVTSGYHFVQTLCCLPTIKVGPVMHLIIGALFHALDDSLSVNSALFGVICVNSICFIPVGSFGPHYAIFHVFDVFQNQWNNWNSN
ncbi:Uncharacterized mitochondrial protein AtMg00310 [Linum grandiflorum]